jgi:hypothetical protein
MEGGNPLRLAFLVMLLAAQAAPAQVATGLPPYASFSGGPFDTVNNANLNVHFAIPVVQKGGRGLPFNYLLSYDSSIWVPVGASGNQTWTPIPQTACGATYWGWGEPKQAFWGYYTYSTTSTLCVVGLNAYYYNVYSNFAYYDAAGTSHGFNITTTAGCTQCNISPVTSGTATATDGSGLTMSVSNYTDATAGGACVLAPCVGMYAPRIGEAQTCQRGAHPRHPGTCPEDSSSWTAGSAEFAPFKLCGF